ncbi:hypothetical protein ROA7450_00791 [Roseovarius albus]|uniref:Uncharacterized protein n=1 Tax=Roseovarius albus TaxID=1247867 RepID=A0A1X6YHS0_9RHOB|nr:hypothetical protein [Roseovarius albus]SLN21746.1 hypothetical protein ROA7450_00791 [Roseovarius albus]
MNQLFVTAPQPTMKRVADMDGPDFYPTPEWATRVLIDNENFSGDIWEPACGDGAMSQVIEERGYKVQSSDLFDRGFGDAGIDFRTSNKSVDNIITNPPFNSAEEFVHAGLRQCKKKLALLLRLAFLESAGRQKSIFSICPPSTVWVFSERITFYPKGAVRKGSGTTAYAWFVWDHDYQGPTQLNWLPVGYKTKK